MATKEEILSEGLKVFAKKGYENTNLETIAKKANITKPAIYYYFKNKKALYNEIFINEFKSLNIEISGKLEEDLKSYVYSLGEFFINNPYIAKLFAKELASEGMHLEKETLKNISSKTLKVLSEMLKNTNINPFFIQTIIVSSFTTYTNTLSMREKLKNILQTKNLSEDFKITDEIYKTISLYIKARK